MNNNQQAAPSNGIVVSLFGIRCCSSGKKLGKGLHLCDERTIRRHVESCPQCKIKYNGVSGNFILRDLKGKILHLHNRLANTSSNDAFLRNIYPNVHRRKCHFCDRCGFSHHDKTKVKSHIQSKCSGGKVISQSSGWATRDGVHICCTVLASKVRGGEFTIPWRAAESPPRDAPRLGGPSGRLRRHLLQRRHRQQQEQRHDRGQPLEPRPPVGSQNQRGQQGQQGQQGDVQGHQEGPPPDTGNQTSITTQTNPSRGADYAFASYKRDGSEINPKTSDSNYIASPLEMKGAARPDYTPQSAHMYASLREEFMSTFGEEHFEDSWFFHSVFLPIVLVPGRSPLHELLSSMFEEVAPTIFDPDKDPPELRILLESCGRWLTSQLANLHVSALPSNVRSNLYNVGPDNDINEEELIRGKTFVATKNVQPLVSTVEQVVFFMYRRHKVALEPTLRQVRILIDASQIRQRDDPDTTDDAADRILETNIVPGFLLRIALETPSTPGGPIIFNYMVAWLCVKRSADKTMQMKSGNEISKMGNQLLRLSRHAMASHFAQMRRELSQTNISHERYLRDMNTHIQRLKTCPTSTMCCFMIRLGKEFSNKRPVKNERLLDPQTGEIMVGQHRIPRAIWSRAIPAAVAIINHAMDDLFVNDTQLKEFLDVKNELVMAGESIHVKVVRTNPISVECIHIDELCPNFGGNTLYVVQEAINKVWGVLRCTMAYLSSGAMRGEEAARLGSYQEWQFMFNHLRFISLSNKNQLHGQHDNTPTYRYMPPSLSRYAIVATHVLFKYMESHGDLYTLPPDDEAAEHACVIFQQIMDLPCEGGPKAFRDIIAVLSNFMSSRGQQEKISSSEEYAVQFSHSKPLHDDIYYCIPFNRDSAGAMVPVQILIARNFHRHLGEDDVAHTPRPYLEDDRTLDRNSLERACRYMFGDKNAKLRDIQSKAMLAIEDATPEAKNVMVLMGCGTGKSALFLIPTVARCLEGLPKKRILVIVPHNPLLYQHKMKAEHALRNLHVKIATISTDWTPNDPNQQDFDICFVSIHAFCKHFGSGGLDQIASHIDQIFIDEIHLLYTEHFRNNTSWEGLWNLSINGAKIIGITATTTSTMNGEISRFMNMGDIDFIGDPTQIQYRIPNVSIRHRRSTNRNVVQEVVVLAIERLKVYMGRHLRACIQVITKSIEDAREGAKQFNGAGARGSYVAAHITSESTRAQRRDVMLRYQNLEIHVLFSTYDVGYDCSLVRDVIIVGARSMSSLIQCIGRIRPNQQRARETRGLESQVHIIDPVASESTYNENEDLAMIEGLRSRQLLSNGQEDDYRQLFSPQPVFDMWRSHECIRRSIYRSLNVDSLPCKLCSFCLQGNNLTRLQVASAQSNSEYDRKRNQVMTKIQTLKTQCFVCRRSNCNGFNCLSKPNGRTRCFKCFTVGCRGAKQCLLKIEQTTMHGDGCRYCYLPHCLRGPNETTDMHIRPGACPTKERLKRVFLYKYNTTRECILLVNSKYPTERIWIEHMWLQFDRIEREVHRRHA